MASNQRGFWQKSIQNLSFTVNFLIDSESPAQTSATTQNFILNFHHPENSSTFPNAKDGATCAMP
jgi:hypothetical protein